MFFLGVHKFQSTLPRGERQYVAHTMRKRRYFNPRSHEGSDCTLHAQPVLTTISIHAPTRGATRFICEQYAGLNISIHAPTRGATTINKKERVITDISIHAPTRGATTGEIESLKAELFQSTLPRGERQNCRENRSITQKISIHAPTRGATIAL